MIKARRRNTGPTQAVRLIVRERFGGLCARCGQPGESVQHRIGRGMGGSSRPEINHLSNLIWLCGDGTRGCHGYVEHNPDDAKNHGWAVHRSLDPREVAVDLWDGRQVLLLDHVDDEGRSYLDVTEEVA